MEGSGSDSDSDWEDCDGEDLAIVESVCLFCTRQYDRPEDVISHCQSDHNFDVYVMKRKHHLDCFGYIKMKSGPDDIIACVTPPPWDVDAYLLPVVQDDGMLQFDIEDDANDVQVARSQTNGTDVKRPSSPAQTSLNGACSEDTDVILQSFREAEARAAKAEEELIRVLKDLSTAREVGRQLIMSAPDVTPQPCLPLTADDDEGYFTTYAHFDIHREMLQDTIRTETYRDVIYNNSDFFKDKVVLDIGCGTGILSMFAAKAGARQVIGIDQSEIIYQAMDIVRENGLEGKIKLIKGKVEEVEIPVEKVDIIISEWMGYFLLYESMLDTVLFARNKWLIEGGCVLPNKCSLSLAALDDQQLYNKHISYWEDVYGFRMSCMKKDVVGEATEVNVDQKHVISESAIIKHFDLESCEPGDLNFSTEFTLTCTRTGRITALVGYFDVIFSSGCQNEMRFSTSPEQTPTHWKQTVFHLEKPIDVSAGTSIEARMSLKKDRRDPRSLVIALTLNGTSRMYSMQ